MILVIDNYDSFTWNLVHYLQELGAEVEVVRNDAISAGQAMSSGAEAFLISPGPCTPNEAGISLELVAACAAARRPLLGERGEEGGDRADARQDLARKP
jgi:anthranilate synthase component 2